MKYIPQAAPFEMIDALISADQAETITQFTVRAGHLFVEETFFTEPGLIENMAQTAAAGAGYKANQANHIPPVGFIGAVKNFEVYQLPKLGDTIQTSTKLLHQVMNASVVEATVHLHQEVIARAEFKIFTEA